jgi:hypothetical protein
VSGYWELAVFDVLFYLVEVRAVLVITQSAKAFLNRLELSPKNLPDYLGCLDSQHLLGGRALISDPLDVIPSKQVDREQTFARVILVDRLHLPLSLRALLGGGQDVELVQLLREGFRLGDLCFQLPGWQGLLHLVVLALDAAKRGSAAHVQQINAVLSLSTMTVALQSRQRPVLSKERQAELLEGVLIRGLSIAILHAQTSTLRHCIVEQSPG